MAFWEGFPSGRYVFPGMDFLEGVSKGISYCNTVKIPLNCPYKGIPVITLHSFAVT